MRLRESIAAELQPQPEEALGSVLPQRLADELHGSIRDEVRREIALAAPANENQAAGLASSRHVGLGSMGTAGLGLMQQPGFGPTWRPGHGFGSTPLGMPPQSDMVQGAQVHFAQPQSQISFASNIMGDQQQLQLVQCVAMPFDPESLQPSRSTCLPHQNPARSRALRTERVRNMCTHTTGIR